MGRSSTRNRSTKKNAIQSAVIMSWRFWRFFRRQSASSHPSNSSNNSAVAGEVEPPDWVSNLDRKASRYSWYELIAAAGVIVSVLLEVWDDFAMRPAELLADSL